MSLFCGNISKNVRSRDLEDEFKRFGHCSLNIKVGELAADPFRDLTPLLNSTAKEMLKTL